MTTTLNNPALLKNIPLFKSFSDSDLLNIINATENGIEEYGSRAIIVRESEIGNALYVITEGTVEVTIRSGSSDRQIAIATLKPGDFFGEQSILAWGSGRRNASVKTIHGAKVFRIDKKYVLLSVKPDDIDSADISAINPKSRHDKIRNLIASMRLFQSLNEQELASIEDWTEVITFGPGDFVVKKFQKGEHLYVVLHGTAEVFTLGDNGEIIVLAELGTGEFFGEQALMPDSKGKRNAFVRANKETKVIRIPKEYFRLVLSRDKKIMNELNEIQKNR